MNQSITFHSPASPKSLDDPLIRGLATSIRYAVRILPVKRIGAPRGFRSAAL